jgi:hypothetical protein
MLGACSKQCLCYAIHIHIQSLIQKKRGASGIPFGLLNLRKGIDRWPYLSPDFAPDREMGPDDAKTARRHLSKARKGRFLQNFPEPLLC